MRKFLHLASILVFVSGCSSTQKIESNQKNVETNKAVVVNKPIAETFNQPPAAIEPAVNSNKVVIGDPSISEKNARRWEGKRGDPADNAPIAANISRLAAAAPDNSEVFSQMNEKGQPMETRVFKNHPRLTKIERLYVTMENPTVTVYLKNGKKITVASDQIANPLTDSAQAILKAAGEN